MPILVRDLVDRAADEDAGIVEQDIEPAEGLRRVRDEAIAERGIRNVAGQEFRRPAGLANRLTDGLAPLLVTSREHHASATLGELDRGAFADAGGGSRHQYRLSVKRVLREQLHHVLLLTSIAPSPRPAIQDTPQTVLPLLDNDEIGRNGGMGDVDPVAVEQEGLDEQ
jgi:hypothetical protein